MQELALVGNFKGGFNIDDMRSGLRDTSIHFGLAEQLKPYFEITHYDVNSIKTEGGISRLVGNDCPPNIFVIQNHINFMIDIPRRVVFYFHIDGQQSICMNDITFAFYHFGSFARNVFTGPNQLTLLPFANLNSFNPNREKDILLSDIPRDEAYATYKDLMERSEFTLVKSNHWLSKRVPEAWACKTIPIVMTNIIQDQKRYSGEHAPAIPFGSDPFKYARDYTKERADKAYEFLRNNHTLDLRFKTMLPIIQKYAQ